MQKERTSNQFPPNSDAFSIYFETLPACHFARQRWIALCAEFCTQNWTARFSFDTLNSARSSGALMHSDTPYEPATGSTSQRRFGATGLTGQLVTLCANPIGEAARNAAATVLMDWLGVAAAGAASTTGLALRKMMSDQDPQGPCTILGMGRSGPDQAAYLNGSYGSLLEMDDLHRASILHAGDVVIPAALAAGQAADCSGTELLDAIVQGYEVALRIGTAAAQGGYSAWYNSGTCGVFGAAMAAARAQGLDADQKCDALGHAGMQAAGLWQCRLEPTDSKCLATAHAARAGVTAARAAAHGLRGARHILEGELGFFATLYPDAGTDSICAPHHGWMLEEVSLKPWPACRHVHPAVGAALHLRESLAPASIADVKVQTYAAGVDFCDQPGPQTPHEARFSFQHAVAVALLRGAPGLQDFTPGAIAASDISLLRNKITVSEDPALTQAFPAQLGAGLEITLTDGTRHIHKAAHAPGDPEMPMTGKEIRQKCQDNLFAAGATANAAAAVIDQVRSLSAAPTLRGLRQALDALSLRQEGHIR